MSQKKSCQLDSIDFTKANQLMLTHSINNVSSSFWLKTGWWAFAFDFICKMIGDNGQCSNFLTVTSTQVLVMHFVALFCQHTSRKEQQVCAQMILCVIVIGISFLVPEEKSGRNHTLYFIKSFIVKTVGIKNTKYHCQQKNSSVLLLMKSVTIHNWSIFQGQHMIDLAKTHLLLQYLNCFFSCHMKQINCHVIPWRQTCGVLQGHRCL